MTTIRQIPLHMLLLAGLLAALAGSVMFAASSTLIGLVIARAIVGLSNGLFLPAARAIAASMSPDRVGERLGTLGGVELAGFVTGPVVGAVLVALGTSAPELATVLIARLRGHDEVAVGTLLGSNIFNTLLIVGTAAIIHPIRVDSFETDVGVLASAALVLFIIPVAGRLARWRSLPLLGSYAVVLVLLAS